MTRTSNRRDFLKQGALASLGVWALGGVSLSESRAANDKLQIACIGVGGKGDSDTNHAGQFGDIVALCDIDDNFLDKKAGKFPNAQKFHDFREMLTKLDKKIDAVTVSTPDHTHAPASIMAMKMGKHVYCQKPLTHSVYEARQMREIAAKMKVCTQMGNQGTAENGLREACEVIQAGAIGPIKEVHVWTNRPIWPQAPKITARPKNTPIVPMHVHWDLFLGPAAERPYAVYEDGKPAYHPFAWRGWWDFGTGALGDMACHTANMAFMALKLGYPTSVVAENDPVNPETYPGWARITFEFPTPGRQGPPIRFVWYEGRKDGKLVLPGEDLLGKVLRPNEKLSASGSLIVGEKGILFSPNDYGAQYRLCPEPDFKAYVKPKPTLPRNGKGDSGMKEEWVAAIKASKPEVAMSNFNYAALLTETILLGNVAMRAGKKLEWDGPNLKFTNAPEANQYLKRDYRQGWTL
jgi:predicted dehydrogenase